MAVVPVDSPGVQDALIVDQFMAGTADVIENLLGAALAQRAADSPGEIIERFVPRHALPLALAAASRPPHRIEDALGIADLVDRRRPFGAVAAAAARMSGFAFELADREVALVDVSEQAASGFAVEADGRHQRIVVLNLARPRGRIVLEPVLPSLGRRKRVEPD